jgi:prepilin-type N-terminal cleavage/methylation domain-containing protein
MNTCESIGGARPSSGAASSEISSPQRTWKLLRPRTGALHRLAFTLIELLVVIAVISLLAAMIFPVTKAINRTKIRRRAISELAQVQAAIQTYKEKVGHYPPDSPPFGGNWAPWINQLYYELKGTTTTNNNGTIYITLDGTARITSTAIPTIFGPSVTGFINTTRGGGDEGRSAGNFIPDIRPSGFLMVNAPGGPTFLLGTTVEGPIMFPGVNGGKLNPWRYNSSTPTNNPSSYDLWVDVTVDGKTNRICNWSTQPLTVSTPF